MSKGSNVSTFYHLNGVNMHYNLALIGFGNVARALARLLLRKQDLLKSQYDIIFSFTGISTGRHGFAVNSNGLDIKWKVHFSPFYFPGQRLSCGDQKFSSQCHV